MLDAAWLIPSLPAIAFFLILFFGKRLPKKGAEVGILAVATSFVMACVAAVQWIDRVENATGHAEGLRAFGKGLSTSGGEHAVVHPVVHSLTWWQSGGVKF